jgi:Mrp family chromosome partitioning ATPase
VGRIDLSTLGPPPIPAGVEAPVKPAQRHRKMEQPAKPASAPEAVAEPVAPPVEVAQPKAEPAKEIAAPEPAEPTPEPAVFPSRRIAVDREHLREQGLILPEGNVTALLEEFRIVKRQLLLQSAELRRQGGGDAAQRILVCSPHPGEGKTYCATNLALSIAAEKDIEVVLVDADFAKPSILSTLGIEGGPGLMDALVDMDADVADFVVGTDIPGLWVLPAGEGSTADTEYLGASGTRRVLDRLTEGAPHRIVIFDTPPALAASPAAELAKYVGQAVMVVRADETGQGALDDAVQLLSACPNIQLLLNGASFSPSGRKFGAYYGYGG